MSSIEAHTTLLGHTTIDFDKKPIRRVLRQEGAAIRKAARRQVARRAVSSPGDMPGRDSGELFRSIKLKMGSGGFWAKVQPTKTNEMPIFYPAVLYFGSAKQHIQKRGNYMQAALDERRAPAQAAIYGALRASLKPR